MIVILILTIKNHWIMILWLDDKRDPSALHPTSGKNWVQTIVGCVDCPYIWLKSYDEFIQWIHNNQLNESTIICFDHDLGEDYDERGMEKNGCMAAKFVLEYCINNGIKSIQWFIQSSNTVGIDNINGYMGDIKKYWKYYS